MLGLSRRQAGSRRNNRQRLREREVVEETNLKVNVIKPIFTFHEIIKGRNIFFIVYLCEKVSGEVKLSFEHTEYRWATKEEILKLDIENYLRAFLENH